MKMLTKYNCSGLTWLKGLVSIKPLYHSSPQLHKGEKIQEKAHSLR